MRSRRANAAAVARICRDLDGIPLAIELAAARVRTMPVALIADRLADRFRLLTSGAATALPRQQTLRAAIDWSYALLSPDEQALLRRLSVFADGFSLEAAEAMGTGGECSDGEVKDRRQPYWQAWLAAESENVLLAHAHAMTEPDAGDAALAIAGMLRWLPLTRHELWHRVCRDSLSHPGAQAPSLLRRARRGRCRTS